MKTVGIVLTGGMSRRFGSPKAFAVYNGRMFYEIAVNVLTPFADKLVISTNKQLAPKFKEVVVQKGLTIVLDDEKFAGKGPLAGMYSAMNAVEADQYLLLPCDMPFMEKEMIEALLKNDEGSADVVAFRQGSREQPLVGMYRRSNIDKILSFLEQGGQSVMSYLQTVTVSWIQAEHIHQASERIFYNMNQPENPQRTDRHDHSIH